MEKVLITGATGFIGQHLVRMLRNAGYNVIAIGRNPAVGQYLQTQGVTVYPCDLTHYTSIVGLPSVDAIVHCAGLAVPWARVKEYHSGNIATTENILRFAETKQVKRLVYISTSSVYATTHDRFSVDETFLPAKFLSAYASTKYQAEQRILNSTVPSIILRPRAVIGRGDTTVLPRIIEAHRNEKLAYFRSEPVMTDTTTIDNLAQAVLLSLHAPPSACGHTFNISDGSPIDLYVMLNELFAQLKMNPVSKRINRSVAMSVAGFSEPTAKLFNREPLLTRYTLSLLATSLTLNIEKARQMLNFIPVANTQEALTAFTDGFQKQRQWQ